MKTRVLPILKMAALVVICTLLAVAASAKMKMEPSATRRNLNFSHSFHKDQGVECDVCHANVKTSTTGKDDLLPTHKECSACHDVTKDCSTCHTSILHVNDRGEHAGGVFTNRMPITDYNAKFSHVRHLDQGKLECTMCHANLDSAITRHQVGHLPEMAQCMSCHDQRLVKTECATCHLKTDKLTPADHDLNWSYRHGIAASSMSDTRCMMCHNTAQGEKMDCNRCHNGDQITSPHPRDYVSRHGADAHLSDTQCNVCHEISYCNDCHSQRQLIPPSHNHPNWAVPGTGGEHRDQAQFDLENCMSCHDVPGQDPVCVRCHGK